MIVVDTSVLIPLLKGDRNSQVDKFREFELQQAPIYIPAVCAQEVLQGARNAIEYKKLYSYFSTLDILLPRNGAETYFAASKIYFDCRSKWLTIRSSVDCLIAMQAIENDFALLQSDRDFVNIAKVRELKLL